MPGSVQNTSQSNKEIGFYLSYGLWFYFKKHLNAFVALKGHNPNTFVKFTRAFIATKRKT